MNFLIDIELVIWGPRSGSEPPSVADMRFAMSQNGFRAELAEDVPVTTAFRRSVHEREGKDGDGNKIKASFLENGQLRGQLDLKRLDQDTHRIRTEFMEGWTLARDKDGSDWDVEGTGDRVTFKDRVRHHIAHYTFADCSQIIQEILKTYGVGAYALRRSGGVYVVPTNGRDMLDRLGRMCDAIGVNLLRYDIPDVRAQRDEIEAAVLDSLTNDCNEHQAALDSYTPEGTKLGVIENRREAIEKTRTLAGRLQQHLGDKYAQIVERIAGLLTRVEQAKAASAAYKPAASRRQIVAG